MGVGEQIHGGGGGGEGGVQLLVGVGGGAGGGGGAAPCCAPAALRCGGGLPPPRHRGKISPLLVTVRKFVPTENSYNIEFSPTEKEEDFISVQLEEVTHQGMEVKIESSRVS